jgi:membrane-bound ClpP family serine protease
MLSNPVIIWLILGIILFAVDRVQNKYNLAYAIYSAFLVCALLAIGIMRTPKVGDVDYELKTAYLIGQLVVFIISLFLFRYVMREDKPKSKHGEKAAEYYSNIIGRTVEVAAGGVNAVSGGKVLFGKETFDAKLPAGGEVTSVPAGKKMQVLEVMGDTLIITELNDD